ncbi:RHS repeat-associated core domain-containing protein [Pandoraea norimbergensis]|uniref:RHS repeat-associated core domain-containing protein n=1 Tax=Pandoraea norimbergensis TaxID=93219 RepID=A0ABN4JM71_9BURK|nr:RHS repeat-associated core domain-containing protein [Pandoraea norimbergensis]ALS62200.1 hypothetical protein AT302_22815 [Pandoraea norimbergensis]
MSPIKHFSSNAQLAFETYASMNRHVYVSPKSGEGLLRIPIASLFADAGISPALDISLSCKTHEGNLNILPCGIHTFVQSHTGVDFTYKDMPLCDGRTLNFELRRGESFNGGDFLVEDAGNAFIVYHKNGVSEKFGISEIPGSRPGAQKFWVYPTHYILPSGRSLTFDWKIFDSTPRVVAINDDDGRLLNADWMDSPLAPLGLRNPAPMLKNLTLFPGSDEQVSYTCAYTNTRDTFKQTIEVTGAIGTAKTIYFLENEQGNIKKFEMRRQQSVAAEKKGDPDVLETSTHTESMDFKDNQVVKHTASPGGGVTALVESYQYETNKTTIACTQGSKNVLTRVYTSKDTGQASEAVTAADVTVLTEQSVSIDKARGVATHKTIKKIDGTVVDELTLEYDAIGNLIKSTKDATTTEWTYYNNYAAYTVKESGTRYYDTSFFGILLKIVDYVNPIGLGFVAFGSGGVTWGTRIDSTVTMSITKNDYAKAAFQLPFAMNYAGDPKGFTSHVESELVYRTDGAKKHSLRLTYYGYAKFTGKYVGGVDREHVLLPGRKLTVMHPSYEEIDVSAEQLKIAKAAASDKEVDTKSLSLASKAMSETMLVGAIETQRSYDAGKRTLIETSGASSAPSFRKLTAFDLGGNMTSVHIETIDGDRKTSAGDKITMAYDGHGRLKTLTPKKGAATAFTYDRFDRLLTSTTNGIEISNDYSAANLAGVAIGGYLKDAKGTITLGQQSVDGLGRPDKEMRNGTDALFIYNGSSRWGKDIDAGARPPTVTGYKSEIDSTGLKYSETTADGVGTLTSKTQFSHRQQIIAFEDITGAKTKFHYDAFGRLVRSKNDSCEATFVYSDNGLLSKETIKAAKQNLTMTVHYSYNRSGIEIKRKFECTGIKTHVIESQRMDDGRINRIMLKVDDKTSNSDYFEYDDSQRLKTWYCSQAGVAGYGGKQYVKQVFDYDKLANVLSSDNEFYTGASRPEKLSVSTTKRVYDDNKPGVLASLDGTAYLNDEAGRLTKRSNRSLAYHGNGQIKSCSATAGGKDGDFVFTYDDLGRIRGGSAGKGRWNETYHYRGQRRYAVSQQDTVSQHGFNKRSLVLKNDSPSCFLQEASTTIDGKTTATSSFELRDQAGTVFASIDLDTKAITYYRFTPYGYRTSDPGALTWLGFKGEPLNYVGLYHLGNGYRMYDPEHCRFQSPDTLSPFDMGGIAAYVYCHGDPLNYHDPSGHAEVAQYSRLDTMPLMYTQEFRIALSVLGVLATPFTSGGSLALAIGMTGLASVAGAFDISAVVLEDSDPDLASVLGYLGLGLGVFNLGAGALAGIGRRAPVVIAGQGLRGGNLFNRFVSRLNRVKPSLAGNAAKKASLQGNKGLQTLTKANSYAGAINGAVGSSQYSGATAKVSNSVLMCTKN